MSEIKETTVKSKTETTNDDAHSKRIRKITDIDNECQPTEKCQKLMKKFSMNPLYETQQKRTIQEFWLNGSGATTDDDVSLLAKPFKLNVLQNFLANPNVINQLMDEIHNIAWTRKQMDLYEFFQSHDLSNEPKNSVLKAFHTFLKEDIVPWMQEVTGLKLTHASASCSMYNGGDYLLVHDDLLSDRRIAFVYYLSPAKECWTEEMGGALELFEADGRCQPMFPECRKVFPRNNQFVFFKVCPESFHQVAEVTTLEYPRITINGWFHETNYESEDSKLTQVPSTSVQSKFSPKSTVDLSEWISDAYLKDAVQRKIQQQIEENSEISLNQFLAPEVFDVMANEFKTNESLKWQLAGPANLRKYEYLKIDDAELRGPIRDLLTLFTSKEMFELLHAYTELDVGGENVREPKCFVEIQRWRAGCYTVLSDSSNDSAESALDLILYFNAVDGVGTITYLSPEGTVKDEEGDADGATSEDDEEEEEEPVNLTIEPKNNELNIVFRSEGTTKFTKYVSKKCLLPPSEYSYLMVCSYKE